MHHSSILDETPVLMLSTGFEPLFQTNWRRALVAVFGGRAEVIEAHKTLTIGTPSGRIPFPLKVRFITGIIAAKVKQLGNNAILSRRNLILRDGGKCQYCGINVSLKTGTMDHVVPRSRGGAHSWENVVLACSKCNQRKADKMPEKFHLKLTKKPVAPSLFDIVNAQLS
jgi:5-methylcytosine-specific restriction endonuclease McrA